jgi:hypothetical protein
MDGSDELMFAIRTDNIRQVHKYASIHLRSSAEEFVSIGSWAAA